MSGQVVDQNQNLDNVVVTFASGDVGADVSGVHYSARACDLPGGANSATVTATDQGGLNSTDAISFTIDAGQLATLDQHIAAGRLDYTNYANCYLEYGSTNPFKLTEHTTSTAGQCQWQDDDASCSGPVVTCSGSQGGGDGGGDNGGGDDGGTSNPPAGQCQAYSTYNYYQKTAGRAYSTGNYLVPDYFATGSDEPLSGSTWGVHRKLGAYSPVVVTCRPGTTPYQTQVSPLDDDNTNQTTRQNEAGYQTGTITGNEPPAAIQQMMYFSQALYRIVSVTF